MLGSFGNAVPEGTKSCNRRVSLGEVDTIDLSESASAKPRLELIYQAILGRLADKIPCVIDRPFALHRSNPLEDSVVVHVLHFLLDGCLPKLTEIRGDRILVPLWLWYISLLEVF